MFWTSVDLPDTGSPRTITFLDGIALEDETESRIEDQRSWGGGELERDEEGEAMVVVGS